MQDAIYSLFVKELRKICVLLQQEQVKWDANNSFYQIQFSNAAAFALKTELFAPSILQNGDLKEHESELNACVCMFFINFAFTVLRHSNLHANGLLKRLTILDVTCKLSLKTISLGTKKHKNTGRKKCKKHQSTHNQNVLH